MSTGRRPDPRRKKHSHQHATHLAVKNGERHPGYKAGELYGCYTHRTFAAQPCLSDVTNDALECPYCKASLIPEWRGYVPIWDRDWTLRYVLINEDYYATTDAIPFHAQLSISRAKNPISPLVIREEQTLVRKLPDVAPWKHQIAMLPICLTLWKVDVLTRWCNENNLLAMVSSKEAEVETAPKPTPVKVSAVVREYTAPTDGADEVKYDAVVNRLAKNAQKLAPSTNGHHKPKPK